MKLQKLVYYSQVWSLALNKEKLFGEPIVAWKYLFVDRKLLESTRNQHNVSSSHSGDPSHIDEDSQETIIAVFICYGQKSRDFLQQLTHKEKPWIDTRNNDQ